MSLRSWIGALCVAVATVGVTACGGGETYKSTGVEVEGTVTLDGKPLEVGMVQAVPGNAMAGGEAATGTIAPDGKFSISNVPVGAIRLAVRTSHMKGMAMAGKLAPAKAGFSGAPQMAGAFRDVPKQYEDPATSNLQATVSKGKNTVNLELKSK